MSESSRAPAPSSESVPLREARRFAKSLLTKVREREAQALAWVRLHHPRPEEVTSAPKLADAQLVAARLMGFRSWPQLKHHHEEMQRYQQEIDEGAPPPDGAVETAHIRCGSDILEGLRRAGYAGRRIEVADPLCQGPVPPGAFEALVATRARFVAHAYELDAGETLARMNAEWSALDDAAQLPRVVLWFEHDSYDQLLLAAVLDRLAARKAAGVELICIAEYPGAPGFRGLGELGLASLRGLWERRAVVGEDGFALGRQVWRALRQPEPRALHALAGRDTPAIPPMRGALQRHLQELPWTTDGLSLTQRLILEVVQAGADTLRAVFRGHLQAEPLPYLGDAMFWWEVRELAAGGALALAPTDGPWPQWGVTLSADGERILSGRGDWRREGGRTRWVGGIPCGAAHPPWRWDPDAGRPRLEG